MEGEKNVAVGIYDKASLLGKLDKTFQTIEEIVWMLNFSAIINWNASERNIEPAFKVNFSIRDRENIGCKFIELNWLYLHTKIKKKIFFKDFANIASYISL